MCISIFGTISLAFINVNDQGKKIGSNAAVLAGEELTGAIPWGYRFS